MIKDSKVLIVPLPYKDHAEKVHEYVISDGNTVIEPLREMSFEEFSAIGRIRDCDCKLIECVCEQARLHKPDCSFRKALTCAVGIECDHGYDVCSKCDPCNCANV